MSKKNIVKVKISYDRFMERSDIEDMLHDRAIELKFLADLNDIMHYMPELREHQVAVLPKTIETGFPGLFYNEINLRFQHTLKGPDQETPTASLYYLLTAICELCKTLPFPNSQCHIDLSDYTVPWVTPLHDGTFIMRAGAAVVHAAEFEYNSPVRDVAGIVLVGEPRQVNDARRELRRVFKNKVRRDHRLSSPYAEALAVLRRYQYVEMYFCEVTADGSKKWTWIRHGKITNMEEMTRGDLIKLGPTVLGEFHCLGDNRTFFKDCDIYTLEAVLPE